jgi:predicted dehydrogenase
MLRFGIVGAGGIARKFGRDIRFVTESEITAVATTSLRKISKYKRRYNVKHIFVSAEAMAKSIVIDAVYIATPHRFHYNQALLFIQNGKHVLVEKPITITNSEFKQLVMEAAKHEVLIMEAMWTYFLPATKYLISLIKNNTYGQLQKCTANLGFPHIRWNHQKNRLFNPNLAGGSLLDLGVYLLSYYLLLSQDIPEDIRATAKFTKSGVDRQGTIDIVDKNGTSFHFKHTLHSFYRGHMTLVFDKATIVMKNFHACQTVVVNKKKKTIPFEGEGFVHEIRSFVECIQNQKRENPIVTHDMTQKRMELMDYVRKDIGLVYPFEMIREKNELI